MRILSGSTYSSKNILPQHAQTGLPTLALITFSFSGVPYPVIMVLKYKGDNHVL